MLDLNHLRAMLGRARALNLNVADTWRWLWSYYGSRISAGARQKILRIPLKKGAVYIRANGFDWSLVDEIFLRHIYDVELKGVGHILDLGGNIGLAALWFAWKFPEARLCTVEPVPENLNVLGRNVAGHPSIRVLDGAVGTTDGTVNLTLSEDPRNHSTSWPGGTSSITVRQMTVPSIMNVMGWDHIDILKIDIEGGEKEVLGGRPEWLKKVRCVIGEGHTGVGYTIEQCRDDLEPLGFEVEEIHRYKGAMLFRALRQRVSA